MALRLSRRLGDLGVAADRLRALSIAAQAAGVVRPPRRSL